MRPSGRRVPHARRISRYHQGFEPKSQRFMLENVILVGLMGAGKTTVGRAVARRLGRQFYDSDHEIEARTGVRIPIIFEHEGEAGFRMREAQAIDELTLRSGIVLATGGGAVLREENRERLKARGTVVYLRANPHDLWLRTRRDRNRPLLQTSDPRARLEQLFQERDALYREVATFIIETGRPSVNALVNMVLMQLEMSGIVPSMAAQAAHDAQQAQEAREALEAQGALDADASQAQLTPPTPSMQQVHTNPARVAPQGSHGGASEQERHDNSAAAHGADASDAVPSNVIATSARPTSASN